MPAGQPELEGIHLLRTLDDALALRAPAMFRTADLEGVGEVENISTSGLLLERCSAPTRTGHTVWLRASYFPGSTEVPLESRVVRTTETGFAVRFVNLTPAAEHMIGQVLPV